MNSLQLGIKMVQFGSQRLMAGKASRAAPQSPVRLPYDFRTTSVRLPYDFGGGQITYFQAPGRATWAPWRGPWAPGALRVRPGPGPGPPPDPGLGPAALVPIPGCPAQSIAGLWPRPKPRLQPWPCPPTTPPSRISAKGPPPPEYVLKMLF